jgi:hypothetical protein
MMRIFEDLLHDSGDQLHAFEDKRRRRGIVLHAFGSLLHAEAVFCAPYCGEHCRQAWSERA